MIPLIYFVHYLPIFNGFRAAQSALFSLNLMGVKLETRRSLVLALSISPITNFLHFL
jgi:hypothetical protein